MLACASGISHVTPSDCTSAGAAPPSTPATLVTLIVCATHDLRNTILSIRVAPDGVGTTTDVAALESYHVPLTTAATDATETGENPPETANTLRTPLRTPASTASLPKSE